LTVIEGPTVQHGYALNRLMLHQTSATRTPWAKATSASLRLKMICSGGAFDDHILAPSWPIHLAFDVGQFGEAGCREHWFCTYTTVVCL